MLKNLKAKVLPSSNNNAENATAEQENKKRLKQKAKEAASSSQNGSTVKKCQLAAVVKSGKFLASRGADQNRKSLGSKKLAKVMNRLRLITTTNKVLKAQQSAMQEDDKGALNSAEEKFHHLMSEEEKLSQEEAEEYSSDDNLSFYSACDYLVVDDDDEEQQNLVIQNTMQAHNASAFNGYLNDSKFILPEEQCDIPTFLHTQNCSRELIDETRRLLRERHELNPESFYEHDYKRMLEDDWTVTRFLLRRRLDPKRTAKLMEECGKFRRQYLMSEIGLWEFPREFHQSGGLFRYKPDRVGNQTLYMRVKMYRRVPEISDVFKTFILCVLEQCDVLNGGRGTAVIFDLTQAGLQNVDLGFLYWLLNSFRNYCPKGVSYILVYNLPWFLSATCKLAMTWLSETNRRSLRFVQGAEIENFIARDQLPDYLGGTCEQPYRVIPAGSRPAIEVCDRHDLTPAQALKIKDLFKEYLNEPYVEEEPEVEVDHEIASTSSASTTDVAQLRQGLNGPSPPTLVRNSSVDSLVPVVNLVSQASKFIVQ